MHTKCNKKSHSTSYFSFFAKKVFGSLYAFNKVITFITY